jgi:hypothetical protein
VPGEVRLDLPLCTAVHSHNLDQRWRINRVSADLTDFMYHPGDVSEVRYQDVPGTDSVRAGSYVRTVNISSSSDAKGVLP